MFAPAGSVIVRDQPSLVRYLFWELLHPVHKQVIDAMTRNKKEKDFDGATTFSMDYILHIFQKQSPSNHSPIIEPDSKTLLRSRSNPYRPDCSGFRPGNLDGQVAEPSASNPKFLWLFLYLF